MTDDEHNETAIHNRITAAGCQIIITEVAPPYARERGSGRDREPVADRSEGVGPMIDTIRSWFASRQIREDLRSLGELGIALLAVELIASIVVLPVIVFAWSEVIEITPEILGVIVAVVLAFPLVTYIPRSGVHYEIGIIILGYAIGVVIVAGLARRRRSR